jgi:D-beta-D-heptose 7-phosphate kinase/D-beta-D-heptose 1-phosphate adenosyltransferase
LLIGDTCVDEYHYGTVDRISPEAPVPIFVPTQMDQKPGMAGNVYENLKALGCEIVFLTGMPSKKIRLIDNRSKQQILRIDQDFISEAIEIDSEIPATYDAVVISDYNKGTISYELIEDLRSRYHGPIFIDTKKSDLAKFQGCIVKINNKEFNEAKSLCDQLIVTLGDQGAKYKNKVYSASKIDVTDVCGAGDTFLSALVYEYLAQKANLDKAIKFAIKASSVTVQHTGVYAPTMEEINAP